MYKLGNYFFYGLCVERDNLVTSSTAILNKLSPLRRNKGGEI